MTGDTVDTRRPPANGKTITTTNVARTAASTHPGQAGYLGVGVALAARREQRVELPDHVLLRGRLGVGGRVGPQRGPVHGGYQPLAVVTQAAIPHLRPVVLHDLTQIGAQLTVQGGGRAGGQPGRGPLQAAQRGGLVDHALPGIRVRLPLRDQREGQHKQVDRGQRGPEEPDRHVLGLPGPVPDDGDDHRHQRDAGDRRHQHDPDLRPQHYRPPWIPRRRRWRSRLLKRVAAAAIHSVRMIRTNVARSVTGTRRCGAWCSPAHRSGRRAPGTGRGWRRCGGTLATTAGVPLCPAGTPAAGGGEPGVPGTPG